MGIICYLFFGSCSSCRTNIGYINDSAYKTEIPPLLYLLTQKMFLFMFWYLKLLFEHSGYLITMALFWICVVKDRHGMVLKVFEMGLYK